MLIMKVAIIGCGAIAQTRHAPAVAANPDAELYMVCDPVKANADALAAQYHTRAVYDIREVLEDAAVSAVIVCTPERFHCENVVAALQAGKDVLCEKPLAMNTAEGEKIVQAWRESGKRLMVAFGQRLSAGHTLAKQLLKQGKIGKPLTFRTALAHRGAEYAALQAPEADFYDKRLAGIGDVMLSVGCHRMDLIPYLFDTRITAVSAMTSTLDKRYADGRLIGAADHAMIHMELENQMVGSAWISWCDYGETERGSVIYGTEGTMHIYEQPGIVVKKKDGGGEEYTIEQDPREWLRITDHFIAVLAGQAEAVCDGDDGLACLLAMEAVEQSQREARRVAVRPPAQYSDNGR